MVIYGQDYNIEGKVELVIPVNVRIGDIMACPNLLNSFHIVKVTKIFAGDENPNAVHVHDYIKYQCSSISNESHIIIKECSHTDLRIPVIRYFNERVNIDDFIVLAEDHAKLLVHADIGRAVKFRIKSYILQ